MKQRSQFPAKFVRGILRSLLTTPNTAVKTEHRLVCLPTELSISHPMSSSLSPNRHLHRNPAPHLAAFCGRSNHFFSKALNNKDRPNENTNSPQTIGMAYKLAFSPKKLRKKFPNCPIKMPTIEEHPQEINGMTNKTKSHFPVVWDVLDVI